MTNNSGKFVSMVSNKEPEMTSAEIKDLVPAAPLTIKDRIEEYFGRYWWVWIILLIVIINKK